MKLNSIIQISGTVSYTDDGKFKVIYASEGIIILSTMTDHDADLVSIALTLMNKQTHAFSIFYKL